MPHTRSSEGAPNQMGEAFSDLEVFNAAIEISDEGERRAFIKTACGGDVQLEGKIDELVAAYARGLERFSRFSPSRTAATELQAEIGGSIGPYKLLQKLGEGGCGVVFEAEQQEPVRRRVALKVIKAGMDTRRIIARFELERQALALMNHPNIARVLEAGATEARQPYFVMDLVEGLPITEFCEQRGLNLRARLCLFAQVCSAVQHAHQKGIIHRDLKPSNIIVAEADGGAAPKIIDFGIAKAVSGQFEAGTILTGAELFLGTPSYMSPEQALITSGDIDTRSDIYSLGVLLYELLTGTPPFENRKLLKAGLDELRRTIREVEPEKPSSRARAQIRGWRIDPDLDWITMKCLEKERAHRYESASDLGNDVHRYLRNEPVHARAHTAAYRAAKFVRRNKAAVAAGAAVAVSLAAATAVSVWQAIRAQRAEKEAQQLTDFLVHQITEADLVSMAEPDPRSSYLLDVISKGVEGKLDAQPLTEAKLRLAVGLAFRTGTGRESLPHFERAFELRRKWLGIAHPDTLKAAAHLATDYVWQRRFREANGVLDDVEASADGGADSLGKAYLMEARANLLRMSGQNAEGGALLDKALAVYGRYPEAADRVITAEFSRFWTLVHSGELDQAEMLMAQMLRKYEKRGQTSFLALMAWKAKAFLHLQRQESLEAERILNRIVPILNSQIGLASAHTMEAEWLLAAAHDQQGRTNEAASIYKRLIPHWPSVAASSFRRCSESAQWFLRHRLFDDATAAFASLRKCYEVAPPNTVEDLVEHARAIAADLGWEAGADMLRKDLRFRDSMFYWLNRAWVSRFLDDNTAYGEALQQALALASKQASAAGSEHLPLEIAVMAPAQATAGSQEQIAMLIGEVQRNLPQQDRFRRHWGSRVLAHAYLQLGDLQSAWARVTEAESMPGGNDAYTLFLKAVCLQRLGRHEDAQAAVDHFASLVQERFAGRGEEMARFASPGELYQVLVLWREVQGGIKVQPADSSDRPER